MANYDRLKHSIMIQFGTSSAEPNTEQMQRITDAIAAIQRTGRYATTEDWRLAVSQTCPTAGHYKYAGVDNSDLNTLLAIATNAARG